MPIEPLSDEALRLWQEAFNRGERVALSPEEGRTLLAEVRASREFMRRVGWGEWPTFDPRLRITKATLNVEWFE